MPPTKGNRVGRKRSDRRWEAPDGTVWASKFEYEIYCILADQARVSGSVVRKCDKGGDDTFSYTTPVRQGRCVQCHSGEVVQERTFTPDICVSYRDDEGATRTYYIEVKGYFPAAKRSLLRGFRKTGQNIDLCVVAQANHWVSKGRTRLSDYFERYLKDVPFIYLNGEGADTDFPEGWV